MKDIVKTVDDFCKNHGSFISLEELEKLWIREHHRSHNAFLEQLYTMIASEALYAEGDHIYLKRVWRQEEFAAERLSTLLDAQPLPKIFLPNTLILGDIILTDEQRHAVAECLSHRLSLLLAKAGSGKTTIAQAIVEYAGTDRYLLCSPTGKAAKNLTDHTGMPASTVHRTLGVKTISDFLAVETMEDIDLIIVDEGTMITVDMLAGILRAASEDCRIVIMGDRNQLPAVGPGDVINDLVALGFPCVSLTKNHRQCANSEALRDNVLRFDSIYRHFTFREDSSFQCHYSEDQDKLMDVLIEDAIARYYQGETAQILTLRNEDVLEINRRIQARVNPPIPGRRTLEAKHFTFTDGDRVILVGNDNRRCCYNGETGILHLAGDGGFSVELEDGRCPKWPYYQAPTNILPAYAITIHRSQGSEYDSVLMYVPRCSACLLHRNSLYTGISRAKHQVALYANPKAVEFGLHTPPPIRRSALAEKTRLWQLSNTG